jgi:nucleoside-diphosphate-sugar epimerase
MKTLLLTGSTGFLGGQILKMLDIPDFETKYGFDTIRLMVRSPEKLQNFKPNHLKHEIVRGDLTDFESLQKAADGVDIVMHVAAVFDAKSSKKAFYSANVDGTRVLMDALKPEVKFILTSTYGVYGLDTPDIPISENYEPKKPFWHYQQSKKAQEDLVFDVAKEKGIDVVTLRPPTILGPNDYYYFPSMINSLKKGEVAYLRKKGENVIPFAHVIDSARAHVLALEHFDKAKGKSYHFASFHCSFKEFNEALLEKMENGKKPKKLPFRLAYTTAWIVDMLRLPMVLNRFAVKFISSDCILDCTNIQNDLGWNSEFDLATSVDETWKWYVAEKPKIRM